MSLFVVIIVPHNGFLVECGLPAAPWAKLLGGDESEAQTDSSRLGAGGRAQLAEDGTDVKLHRIGRDAELGCDLFVREAFHHHLEEEVRRMLRQHWRVRACDDVSEFAIRRSRNRFFGVVRKNERPSEPVGRLGTV